MELNNDLEALIGKKVEVRIVLYTPQPHLICEVTGILEYSGGLFSVFNCDIDGVIVSEVWMEPYMEYKVTLSEGLPIIEAVVHK